ncbi:hypothetical protein HZH66_015109 [Vespula vulgaris]|uniref:Uncharacterized protein n=1 Tax=Vespula vulgaris TaxID=7454 RepID=A0A834MMT9_VESVU|nr:hypothetical protein HZH66_015109 [Vespula vulgaris]
MGLQDVITARAIYSSAAGQPEEEEEEKSTLEGKVLIRKVPPSPSLPPPPPTPPSTPTPNSSFKLWLLRLTANAKRRPFLTEEEDEDEDEDEKEKKKEKRGKKRQVGYDPKEILGLAVGSSEAHPHGNILNSYVDSGARPIDIGKEYRSRSAY